MFCCVGPAAFVRADESLVAQAAEANRRYWIVGIVLAALLVAVASLALALVLWRGRKRKKQDAAVGSPAATLVDTATQSKLSRSNSAARKPVTANKSVISLLFLQNIFLLII